MIRMSRLTDYGLLILARLAQVRTQATPGGPQTAASSCSARELSRQVEVPLPMVSKVLKSLTRAGVLDSQRGAHGGYSLARRPEELTVADIIAALEGPLALTECSAGPAVCDLEASCAVRSPLLVINQIVRNSLAGITLADLTNPAFAAQLSPLDSFPRIHPHEGGASPFNPSPPNQSMANPNVKEL